MRWPPSRASCTRPCHNHTTGQSGRGFADQIEVAEGTTLGQLFQQRMPGSDPHNYLIRVNPQPAVAEEPLAEGCRVSVKPTKIQGATALA
ncbi:MAG: molybdopterin converting factor [Tepidisphaeraceae bacterium]